METSTPNIQHAKVFAEAIRKEFPNKMFAYNCSPSFNWEKNLSAKDIANFQVVSMIRALKKPSLTD